MKLWDILNSAQYTQKFRIFVTNIYDQNLPRGHGTLYELHENIQSGDEEDDFFSHLMDEVEYFVVLKDKSILIYLRNENYEKRCEELYPEEYVKRWDRLKPETRPWRFSIEIELGEG